MLESAQVQLVDLSTSTATGTVSTSKSSSGINVADIAMGGGAGIKGGSAPIAPAPYGYENGYGHGHGHRDYQRAYANSRSHKSKNSTSGRSFHSQKGTIELKRSEGSVSTTLTIDKHLPPVGLKNVGNTCYANAALQCVLSTALSHALLDPSSTHVFRRYSSNPGILALGSGSVDSDEDDIDESEHDTSFGSGGRPVTDLSSDSAGFPLPPQPFDMDSNSPSAKERKRRLKARVKVREERKSMKEKQLKHEKCQWLTGELTDVTRIYTSTNLNLNSEESKNIQWQNLFQIFSVNDEQRIVDPGGITRHVNKISPCLRPYQQEDAHEFLRSLLSTLTLDGHNKRLSSLFDGLLESAVTCQTCHRASITRDRYMDLSLDIQGKEIEDLRGALKHFTQTEILDKDNKVTCERCKTKRIVSKGLRLATAPTVLVCHLKRFAFNIYGQTTRLSKFVEYPITLEIGDFMSRANQSKPPPYELVGVLVHAGQSCERGHYLAFVKSGSSWYKANDEEVTLVDEEVVLRQQAYILFYEVEGMRVRNGYKGFGRYHRRTNLHSSERGADARNPEGTRSSSASPSMQERLSASAPVTPSSSEPKISTLLDSVLNLCGATSAAEAVRDAICDSDRKSKKKGGRTASNDSADSYMARLEPHTITTPPVTKKLEEFPKCSTEEKAPKTPYKYKKIRSRSTSKKSSRRKSRRSASANQKDSIFRGNFSPPNVRPSSDTGAPCIGAESLRAYLPTSTEFSRKQSDRSILSSDSRLIRSFSSNKMFEMEEEAIGHEKESRYNADMAAGVLSDDDFRMSDQSAPIVTKRPSLRRKSSSRTRRDGATGLSKSAHGVELPPLPRKPP